jgi:cyclophilin family peptidyl-prolyl cis-trans isomerase
MKKTIIACALLGCAHTSDFSAAEDARDSGSVADSLRDSDPKVRARAAVALGRIASPSSLPSLRAALGDKDSAVRAAVAFALGIAEDEPSERALVTQLAAATSQPERDAIETALGRVGGELAAEVLARVGDTRSLIALGIIGYRKKSIPANSATRIVARLADADAGVRWAAAYALSRMPFDFAQAVAPLKAACADADPGVRAIAVRALVTHGPDEVATFETALGDADWHVRVQAARALGGSAAGAIKLAAKIDSSTDTHTLMAALEALRGEAARPEVQAAAARFGTSSDARIRCAAGVIPDLPKGEAKETRGCGPDEVRVTRSAAELRKLWDSGDKKIQVAVAEQVGRMVVERQGGAKLLAELVEEAKDPGALSAVADAVRAAGESGWREEDTAGRLAKKLGRDLPLEARISIVGALGTLEDKAARGALERSLSHHNAAVRKTAREALAKLELKAPTDVSVDRPPPSKGNVAEAMAKKLRATIRTDRGDIVVELFGADAPLTVASFVHLARSGFYRGLPFHRVVPDFVIQGGDPRGDGYGGADYDLRCEYNARPYVRGAVGMAHAGKDTGSSQFFITHSPQPHLDGRHTLFGQVVQGLDVVDAIQPGDAIREVTIGAAK